MLLNPAIIALLSTSLLVTGFAVYAAAIGIQIIRRWDLEKGSEEQLWLERKTYLVSTIFSCVLGFELLSLFLFVYSVDQMHDLFIGAMCAAGSLNVNDYGYPALVLKAAVFFLSGIWMIVNYADNQGYDYPLIRAKYKFLLVIVGLLLLEGIFQTRYLAGLRVDVIASCCGVIFDEGSEGLSSGLASLPHHPLRIALFLSMALTVRTGIHVLIKKEGVRVFSSLSIVAMIIGLISIISFVSVYYYELPTHHCPFCLLQKEYYYIGYPLYLTLFIGGIAGAGAGTVDRLAGPESLRDTIPVLQKRLCILSLTSYILFTAIAVYPMVLSDFVLE